MVPRKEDFCANFVMSDLQGSRINPLEKAKKNANNYSYILSIIDIEDIKHLQGESKKSGISKIMGITSLKYIRKGHIGGVLENSGYLLPDGH